MNLENQIKNMIFDINGVLPSHACIKVIINLIFTLSKYSEIPCLGGNSHDPNEKIWDLVNIQQTTNYKPKYLTSDMAMYFLKLEILRPKEVYEDFVRNLEEIIDFLLKEIGSKCDGNIDVTDFSPIMMEYIPHIQENGKIL